MCLLEFWKGKCRQKILIIIVVVVVVVELIKKCGVCMYICKCTVRKVTMFISIFHRSFHVYLFRFFQFSHMAFIKEKITSHAPYSLQRHPPCKWWSADHACSLMCRLSADREGSINVSHMTDQLLRLI